MLQISTFLLETDLEAACKVVNHSDTFLFGDGSDVPSDCLFQFRDCLRVVLIYTVLQITPKKKSGGFKLGE